MRIISDFKDYYDCMMAYGYDPKLVYNRTKIAEWRKSTRLKNYYAPYLYYGGVVDFSIERYSVGFCGKWYQYFELYNSEFKTVLRTYKIEDIDKFVDNNFNKKQAEKYYTTKWIRNNSRVFDRTTITEWIKRFDNIDRVSDTEFLKYDTPIIINHKTKFNQDKTLANDRTFNGCLKDCDFFKVMEPWQVYQELSMYLGCQLVDKFKKIPVIDDVTMAQAKGFDKWSFRSPPKT